MAESPLVPPLVEDAIKQLSGNATELVGSAEAFLGATRESLINALPDALKTSMLRIQEYLESTIGETFASVATGVMAGLIDYIILTNKALGIALGSVANAKAAGEQAANIANPVGVIDPQSLAKLALTGRIALSAMYQEMKRQGYDEEHANGYIKSLADIIGVPDALTGLMRETLSEAKARDILLSHGFVTEEQNILITNAQNRLTLLEYVQGWNRKYLSDVEFERRCKHIGISGSEFALVKQLSKLIPGPSDLVRMAVREAFSEEQSAKLDLDAEFPEPFAEWTEKQGLTKEWAQKYWRAHWELPSPTQAFEMFHRTTDSPAEPGQQPLGHADGKPYYTVMSKDQLTALIKAQDYAPTWRDKLLAISYNTLTRVDVRRMYGLGILSADQVRRAYFDIGYNEADSANLAAFTIAEEQESNLGVIKARMLLLYRRGIVTSQQLTAFLLSLKIPQTIVDTIITAEDMLAAAEDIERHLAAIRAQYFQSVLKESELVIRLTALGLPATSITRIVSIWIDEKAAKVSRLTILNLQKAFKGGLITEQEFRDDLRERRMTPFDIDIMVKLYEPFDEALEPAPEEPPPTTP